MDNYLIAILIWSLGAIPTALVIGLLINTEPDEPPASSKDH